MKEFGFVLSYLAQYEIITIDTPSEVNGFVLSYLAQYEIRLDNRSKNLNRFRAFLFNTVRNLIYK